MFSENQVIGPYTLIKYLGGGGMGEVWLATRGAVGSERALKIPRKNLVRKDAALSEAKRWQQAGKHANIVRILEAEEYDDTIIIASEYHEDGSLHQYLEQHGGKAASLRVAVTMVLEILKGLDYLHSLPEPLIHRDLKPANILLQGEKPLIADFGLSRFIDETWSGRTLGTLAYMAPECFKSGGSRSAQTDIWSVGVVFYKLVAGHLPFPQQDPPALNECDLCG